MTRSEACTTALAEFQKHRIPLVVVEEGPHADEFAVRDAEGKSYGFCPVVAVPILYKWGIITDQVNEHGITPEVVEEGPLKDLPDTPDDAPLNDQDFLSYLSETLIPDLRESGRDATADDFQRCVEMLNTTRTRLATLLQLPRRQPSTDRYFVVVHASDGANIPTRPAPIALDEVSNHLHQFLSQFRRNGYYLNARRERLPLHHLSFTLVHESDPECIWGPDDDDTDTEAQPS